MTYSILWLTWNETEEDLETIQTCFTKLGVVYDETSILVNYGNCLFSWSRVSWIERIQYTSIGILERVISVVEENTVIFP